MLLLLLLAPGLLAQETVLITAGFNGGVKDSCELLDSSCLIPSLPWNPATNRSARSDHIAARTGDGVLLTCGGEAPDGTDDLSCYALDLTADAWVPHSVLDRPRIKATAVSSPAFGILILGGFKEESSSHLMTGATEWIAGPTLPSADYFGICSVLLSDTSFLVIGGRPEGALGGTRVREIRQAASGAWEQESWPDLYVDRWGHACARLGDQVIVAGGVSPFFTMYSSTTVFDLNTREQREAGEMFEQRTWFGMAVVQGRLLAFGGMGPYYKNAWGQVEEWQEEEEEWLLREETMPVAKSSFASLLVTPEEICRNM